LERLAHKYRVLAALRRAKACGQPEPPRSVFRELAREFPGALSELDRLPLDEIDGRARALDDARAGGDVAPWMRWMIRHGALFRAALHVKARLAGVHEVDDALAKELAAEASQEAASPLDEAFVRSVARPPAGRIARVVLARLAAELNESEATIRSALRP